MFRLNKTCYQALCMARLILYIRLLSHSPYSALGSSAMVLTETGPWALVSQPLMSADFWLGLAIEKCGKNGGKKEARVFHQQLSLPGFHPLYDSSFCWPGPLLFQLILIPQFLGLDNTSSSLSFLAYRWLSYSAASPWVTSPFAGWLLSTPPSPA